MEYNSVNFDPKEGSVGFESDKRGLKERRSDNALATENPQVHNRRRRTGALLLALIIMFAGVFSESENAYAYASSHDETIGGYFCRVQAYATGSDTGGSYYVGYGQNCVGTYQWSFGTYGYSITGGPVCGYNDQVSIYGPSCEHNYDFSVKSYMAITQLDVFNTYPVHTTAYNHLY